MTNYGLCHSSIILDRQKSSSQLTSPCRQQRFHSYGGGLNWMGRKRKERFLRVSVPLWEPKLLTPRWKQDTHLCPDGVHELHAKSRPQVALQSERYCQYPSACLFESNVTPLHRWSWSCGLGHWSILVLVFLFGRDRAVKWFEGVSS